MFTQAKMKLFLTAKHLLYREALLYQLLLIDDSVMAGEASTGVETLERLRHVDANVLIIEEDLKDNDGLTIAEFALQQQPNLAILLLVDSTISQSRLSIYLESGIKCVISKAQPINELIRALHYLSDGQVYIDSEVIGIGKSGNAKQSKLLSQLSEREREVADMIAQRIAIKHIAEKLGVSNKTVHTYKDRVLVKLGLERLPELIVFINRYDRFDDRV